MRERRSDKTAISVSRAELFVLQDLVDDACGDCALGRRLHALTGEKSFWDEAREREAAAPRLSGGRGEPVTAARVSR